MYGAFISNEKKVPMGWFTLPKETQVWQVIKICAATGLIPTKIVRPFQAPVLGYVWPKVWKDVPKDEATAARRILRIDDTPDLHARYYTYVGVLQEDLESPRTDALYPLACDWC